MAQNIINKKCMLRDFPGGPVVKTPCSQCRGHGFDPWSGNEDPTCHTAWPKKRKQKRERKRENVCL